MPTADKLVFFDIDDTLVRRVGDHEVGFMRWAGALSEIFGVEVDFSHRPRYDGWVDRQIGRDLAQSAGVSQSDFDAKFELLTESLYRHALKQTENGKAAYEAIPQSARLVKLITDAGGVNIALLTGNLEKIGWWKLAQSDHLDRYFRFGAFSDHAQDRIDLAKQGLAAAKEFFRTDFTPERIFVTGDTANDIRCGKSIGARTIGIENYTLKNARQLEEENADLVVDNLTDNRVLDFIYK